MRFIAASRGARESSALPFENAIIATSITIETATRIIGVRIFLRSPTPRMLIAVIVIRMNMANIFAVVSVNSMPKLPSIAMTYALKPISAKADFNMNEAHRPSPEIVPIIGPNVLSIYTYAPPDFGIAEDNSALDMAPGITTIPDRI